MRVSMSHAFAVNANGRVHDGVPWNEHHPVGRFEVHFAQMANPAHVRRIHTARDIVLHDDQGNPTLQLNNVEVTMVSANIEVVFIVLRYDIDLDPRTIVSHIHALCRERHRVHVDGVPFSCWLADCVPNGAGVGLATDVLQVVTFPEESPTLLRDADGPTALCQSLVSRHWSENRRSTAVELPSELNASGESCFAHGRGVIASAGHDPYIVAGAMMVVVDLLFAAAEVRRIRNLLTTRISELRNGIAGEHREGTAQDLRRTITEVRQSRLTLAVDVIPALTGVDTPDRVLDSVRETFGASLKIAALIDGAQTLLSTLTQVTETFIAEHEMASTVRFEERQRQWQFSVSVVSGVIVPFALLLSFFGIGTQSDVQPTTSMWEFGRYWQVWTIAGLSVVMVLAVSWWRYWRWLRAASARRIDGTASTEVGS